MAFRDYLLSSTVSDTLDVWELKGDDNLTIVSLELVNIRNESFFLLS